VADYQHAVHLLRPKHPGWQVPVLPVSALTGGGVDEAWTAVAGCVDHLRETGDLTKLRSSQAVAWMWDEIRETLLDSFRRDPAIAARWPEIEAAVRSGRLSPASAARTLLGDEDGADGP
jgi:LAO/AO transport system kinase